MIPSLVVINNRGVLKKKFVDPYDFGPGQFRAFFGPYEPEYEFSPQFLPQRSAQTGYFLGLFEVTNQIY